MSAPTVEVGLICARPACRATFVRRAQVGRLPDYCGEECRRAANTERRRVISLIETLERQLCSLRHDLDNSRPAADAGEGSGRGGAG